MPDTSLQVTSPGCLTVLLLVVAAACGSTRTTTFASAATRACGSPNPADTAVYDTTQVDQKPVVSHGPLPRYPAELRMRGIEGAVVLSLVIDALGRPEPRSIAIVSAPDPDLALAARTALRRTGFAPACRDGHAVRVRAVIRYTFSLRRS